MNSARKIVMLLLFSVVTACSNSTDVDKKDWVNEITGSAFKRADFPEIEILSQGIIEIVAVDHIKTSTGLTFLLESPTIVTVGEPVKLVYSRRETIDFNTQKCMASLNKKPTDKMYVFQRTRLCAESDKWCISLKKEEIIARVVISRCG